MRKIEQQLNNAIKARKGFKLANTRLEWADGLGRVFLHGHHIATIDDGRAVPIPATFSAWPTRTTASRLRALGIGATIRKGEPCIDGQPV